MPNLERKFQRKVEESTVGMSLDTNASNHLQFGSAGLVFQKEVMFEQREIWKNGKICLTEVDKDSNLKDRIGMQMNQLDFVVMEKATKKFVGWEAKPTLEEGGENNDFVGVMRWEIFILSRSRLEDDTGREKVFVDEFEELALIDGRRSKHFRVRSSHGGGPRA
jgi:hypothetical protein